ncbi:MAG: histidine kinase [Bacillota bacterium]|nr:histidine kinase [Bacillota bacterium]
MQKHREYIGLTLVLLVAVFCLLSSFVEREDPSFFPTPRSLVFQGECSRDRETWLALTENSSLSSLEGEIFLRGEFSEAIPEGLSFNFYVNHIAAEIFVNGESRYRNAAMEKIQKGEKLDSLDCAALWEELAFFKVEAGDQLEIHLANPHRYGNANAYWDFLESLNTTIAESSILATNLRSFGGGFRALGGMLAIFSLVLLGASIASLVLRVPVGWKLFKAAILTLLAGGFFYFDTLDICYQVDSQLLFTYGRQISMMLVFLFIGFYICDSISGKRQKLLHLAMLLSCFQVILLLVLSITGIILLYDAGYYWGLSQLILCPLLALCCGLELPAVEKKGRLSLFSGILLSISLILDLAGLGNGIVTHGTCTKIIFVLLFAIHLSLAAGEVVANYQALLLARKLEMELQNSRIAIMLSQIKPHFLHNSLAVIQELCHEDPLAAEDAIGIFAEYLKGNMRALESDGLIWFKEELSHTKCYLDIEKMRFGDQLCVKLNTQKMHFRIPSLTLQPIVENAVRHGARKNENGGFVSVSTVEHTDHFEVLVEDDGPGFDPEQPLDDGNLHLGIRNVQERLRRMCGGELRIESDPSGGTRVHIILPKEGRK